MAVPTSIAVTPAPRPAPPPERWHYHPPELGNIEDGMRLPDGRWLLIGDGGERWLTEPLPRRRTAMATRSAAISRTPAFTARLAR